MIIVQLNGGLGNQLFQYALGRRLAYQHSTELCFDLSSLEADWSYRQYKLRHFHVQGYSASVRELRRFYFFQRTPAIRRINNVFQNRRPYYRRKVILEQATTFDVNILNAPDGVALIGYWQSEKYFRDIRSVLLKEIHVKEPFDTKNQEVYEKINITNSVSLHIRRGDYVSNPKTNQVHGVLPLGYYQKAMKLLADKVKLPHYYVFSDDISWARHHLQVKNLTFIEHNGSQRDYFDLMLMRACKYHIIANSSFSWWGAWLSNFPEKLVFAPKQWYQANVDTYDLLPVEWRVV